MSRKAAIILSVSLAILIVAAALIALFLLLSTARTPQVHLLPDGYKGFAYAKYGVAGAPALPVENGQLVFRYGADGKLETSTQYEEGWSVSNYFYVDGDERKPLRQMPPGFEGQIWGAGTTTSMVIRDEQDVTRIGASSHFFVGTEEEYREAERGWILDPGP